MKCLLIGGTHDGEAIDVSNELDILRFIKRPYPQLTISYDITENKVESNYFEYEEYKKQEFHFGTHLPTKRIIYIAENLNIIQALDLLIENYKPKEK